MRKIINEASVSEILHLFINLHKTVLEFISNQDIRNDSYFKLIQKKDHRFQNKLEFTPK